MYSASDSGQKRAIRISKGNTDQDKRVAGIDIGISNLATVTSNLEELSPFIVCGKAIKSTNQYFNKYKARLQSLLPSGK